MKQFSFNTDAGVICGEEHNPDLFIRKTVFDVGYSENDFHNHPNSFEFYLVLEGELTFANEKEELPAAEGSIVYFQQGELHKITSVSKKTTMLLFKKVGSTKI